MPWVDIEKLVQHDPPTKREAQEVEDYIRRKAKARFYADENFPAPAINALRRLGADVLTAEKIGKRGHPDENHLAEAKKRTRIFITCDRDFLDERRFPLIRCPALIVFDFGSGTAHEIVDTLDCLSAVLNAPQFYDKWTKIHAKGGEWTEYTRFSDGSTSRSRYRAHNGKFQQWINTAKGL